MADFVDQITAVLEAKRSRLTRSLGSRAHPQDADLARLVRQHWLRLPVLDGGHQPRPAYAVDGSSGRLSLEDGSALMVGQAMCLGVGGYALKSADVTHLTAVVAHRAMERIADLMLRHLEFELACQALREVPRGSLLYLDGALYGVVPQLYPLGELGEHQPIQPAAVLDTYVAMLHLAEQRDVLLLGVAKTSREATHCKLWTESVRIDGDVPYSDAELIHRWTDSQPGHSTAVLLGSWGFTRGSSEILETRPDVAASPAIVSLFVRLAEHDTALRIDAPATAIGCDLRLADIKGRVVGSDWDVRPLVTTLMADYGGLDVYNALLYSVDREVRLRRSMLRDVYLPLIGASIGQELRLDRSQRRF
jgi:hypothetical protein